MGMVRLFFPNRQPPGRMTARVSLAVSNWRTTHLAPVSITSPIDGMKGRVKSLRRLAGVTAAVLAAGCTPTVNRLEPYRDDPAQARALEQRAEEICCRRRGPDDLPPHHFTTDGCSLWPDSTWVSCCVEHDIAYWCGGTCEDRERADETLRDCVTADSAPAGMGTVMYVGVRAGALPWYPFPFRWGYGWDWPRSYDSAPPAGGAAAERACDRR